QQRNRDFLEIQGPGDLGGQDVDLRAFFEEMGVQWPARSSIKFVRGLGKLVVANTQENLAVFESILAILNVVPYQIEIEARFIEVAQTDIDSLGLEWMLTDNWQIAEMAADANLPPAARRRIQMAANATSGGFTQGNRFLTQDGSMGPQGSPIMDRIATVSSVLTNPELSMVLHALQQRGHTDLLSAPKITTQSGQQAVIKVVTEYIYPTAFDTSGIEGGTTTAGTAGGTVGAVVTPLDFQTREVGVILTVLPTVSPEGQMIDIDLAPEVVSEPTWRNYGSTYTSFDPNGNPVEQVLNMEQPFFHTRKLQTKLLIYNGATVVMGGMITELRNSVDDSIPLLGDIPILGRLFRSKYDYSEKRNLLIFVTARLVDPAGRPLDQERLGIDRGLAERIAGIED
ncbi:MAG: type II secretion system protein GspD, partial [Kiritimatiellia bacterium]